MPGQIVALVPRLLQRRLLLLMQRRQRRRQQQRQRMRLLIPQWQSRPEPPS